MRAPAVVSRVSVESSSSCGGDLMSKGFVCCRGEEGARIDWMARVKKKKEIGRREA